MFLTSENSIDHGWKASRGCRNRLCFNRQSSPWAKLDVSKLTTLFACSTFNELRIFPAVTDVPAALTEQNMALMRCAETSGTGQAKTPLVTRVLTTENSSLGQTRALCWLSVFRVVSNDNVGMAFFLCFDLYTIPWPLPRAYVWIMRWFSW